MIRNSTILRVGLFLVMALIGAMPQSVQSASATSRPVFLYIAYNNPSVAYADYFSASRQLGQMLEEKIGRAIVVKVPYGDLATSNDKVIQALRKGKADVAWLSWAAYLVAHKNFNVTVAVSSTSGGQPTYAAQFLTHSSTGFDKLSDLEGKNICWVEPLSTSGYVVPSLMLKAARITPGTEAFLGSHPAVVRALYERGCESGATYEDARVVLEQEFPDVYDVVQVIALSPPIPNIGFSIAENVPPDLRTSIANALVEISNEDARLIRTLGGFPPLTHVDHSIYSGIETLIEDADLTVEDVWEIYYH